MADLLGFADSLSNGSSFATIAQNAIPAGTQAGDALKFGTTVARAAAGDPTAMFALAKDVNPFKVGSEAFKIIFSAGGVSPSFFNTFSFLSFLDNSTGQWKSKSAKMRGWTPPQRLAWYLDQMKKNDAFTNARQYIGLYTDYGGNPHKVVNDSSAIPYDMALLFNSIVIANCFVEKDVYGWHDGGNGWQQVNKKNMLLDLSKTQGYAEKKATYEKVVAEQQRAIAQTEVAPKIIKSNGEVLADSNTNVNDPKKDSKTTMYIVIGIIALVIIALIVYLIAKRK